MDAKEEVRARIAIEDVVGEYVQLKRAGRTWKGLSPFSDEKTASFFVSPDKQIWHDFSSNQGGDVFSFIMMVEGIDFRAALELLARKAGVDLSLYDSGRSKGLAERKQRLIKLLDIAATYYQRALIQTSSAIDYVKERGLSREAVHSFRLGYAPNGSDSLTRFLQSKGYDERDIKEAGLIGSRGTDMFRDRLMVPLADGQGQVIGFTARALQKDIKGPKYINTPQTVLYDKSRNVFGLHLAKEAIRRSDYAVIVEGNLDVVSSHQVGVRQVVATAGTALTEQHLKALSRLTSHIRLSFDGDKAGIAATERAIPIAQAVGVELSIISLPDDTKDPDELIQKDPKLWEKAIDSPQPALEWLIDQYEKRVDTSSASGKRQVTTAALPIIAQVTDPVEREHYMKLLSERLGTSLEALESRFEQLSNAVTPKRMKTVKNEHIEMRPHVQQDYLLALMAIEAGAADVAKQLKMEDLESEERQQLFAYLREHPGGLQDEQVPASLHQIETYVKIVLLKAETRYLDLDGQDRLVEAVSLVRQIKQQQKTKKKQMLTDALRDAEGSHDDAAMTRLRQELNTLIKED